MSFSVDRETANGFCVVRVHGDVDVEAADRLRGQLDACLGASNNCVIDLSDVEFMDSTGLGVLTRFRTDLTVQGRSLRLVVAPGRIMKLFRVTALHRVFDIRGDLNNAINYFAA